MSPPRPVLVASWSCPVEEWPLHDTASTQRMEAIASQALPAHALMQRAGLAVAKLAMAVAPHARRVRVVCGPGNNGGDGLLAAAHLHRAGKSVDVLLVGAAGSVPADAAAALQVARDTGVRITNALDAGAPMSADLAIDALFGIGLTRAPQGVARAAIAALRSDKAPVMAVDVPSGLEADTGAPLEEASTVQARWTLSLLSLKPGLFTAGGRDHAGDVWFDDLGIPADATPAVGRLVTGSASLWPQRRHAQHKGSFGDMWVVGGAAGLRGAAWLAARAGLAAGAGRVLLVAVDGDAATEFDPMHPELMVREPQALLSRETPLEKATVVCGCGAGSGGAWMALLPTLIARAGRLLLDADAINALAADSSIARGLHARAERGRPTLMTPHPLEAARWLGSNAATVQADRIASARKMARESEAHVVLKGSGSVVCAPDGTTWINGSGNAALAGAGTGDVLAGWIGGLWSQGLQPADAAVLAVHSHGAAADRWRERTGSSAPLEASQLIDALREHR